MEDFDNIENTELPAGEPPQEFSVVDPQTPVDPQESLEPEASFGQSSEADYGEMNSQSLMVDSEQEYTMSARPPQHVKNETTIGSMEDLPPPVVDDGLVTVQPVKFANFENDEFVVGMPRKNIDIMQDVDIKVTVELGRTKMKVRKVLDMAKGTIIEINKVAGEQVELYVCGKLVAYGEVIVIEDKFGLRITSIAENKPL